MVRDDHLQRWRDRTSIAISLSLALLAGGCAGGFGSTTGTTAASPPPSEPQISQSGSTQPPSTYTALKDKVENFFSNSSATSQQSVTVTGAPQVALDCPLIDIRSGASTLQIPPPSEDQNSTMALKYQGTFVRAARECALVNKQMVMKIGIEGRIIVGPAGGPGEVDVPLRIAVVDETTAGTKPIATRFIRLPVTVGSGSEGATFSHVEDGVTFPMPSAADLENYVIYIGFDPLAAQAQDDQKQKPKARAKPKLKPKAPPPPAPPG
jgi:hypothetical protein